MAEIYLWWQALKNASVGAPASTNVDLCLHKIAGGC